MKSEPSQARPFYSSRQPSHRTNRDCSTPRPAHDSTRRNPTAFELADVHPSAHTTTPYFTGGSLRGDRYLLHNATMVDMISLAYGMDTDNVLSGSVLARHRPLRCLRPRPPRHLARRRQAHAPRPARRPLPPRHPQRHPPTRPPTSCASTKALPSSSRPTAPNAPVATAHPMHPPHPPGGVPYNYITCHNLTLDPDRRHLKSMAGGYLTNPVVNATGLQGSWDFDIHWTSRGNLQKPAADGISIFDAVQKQLGLKLALEQYPTPVVIVDNVDEKPTPNAPGLDKALPPPPPAEFDVAVLTPSKPDAQQTGRITANQVNATGFTLRTSSTTPGTSTPTTTTSSPTPPSGSARTTGTSSPRPRPRPSPSAPTASPSSTTTFSPTWCRPCWPTASR